MHKRQYSISQMNEAVLIFTNIKLQVLVNIQDLLTNSLKVNLITNLTQDLDPL